VAQEVTSSEGQIVLFIDREIHTVVGAGGPPGSDGRQPNLPSSRMLAAVSCVCKIGATTSMSPPAHREGSGPWKRRFSRCSWNQPWWKTDLDPAWPQKRL